MNVAMETHVETIMIEANVMLDMLETGILPACAKDLHIYTGETAALSGSRSQVYAELAKKTKALSDAIDALPGGDTAAAAKYTQEVIRPKMAEARVVADEVCSFFLCPDEEHCFLTLVFFVAMKAERLIQKDLYPYPSYQRMLFRPQTSSVVTESEEEDAM